jgi:hypothetical protein
MSEERKFSAQLGDHTVSLSTGKIMTQAGGTVLVQSGETVLLAAATMSPTPRAGIDFFPLTVDFEERLYAAGRIRALSSGARGVLPRTPFSPAAWSTALSARCSLKTCTTTSRSSS